MTTENLMFGISGGKKFTATIYIDDLTKMLLARYGGGNLSLGIRLAARAVSASDGTVQAITPEAVRAVSRTPEARRVRGPNYVPEVEVLCRNPYPGAGDAAPGPVDNMFADLMGEPYDPNDPDYA